MSGFEEIINNSDAQYDPGATAPDWLRKIDITHDTLPYHMGHQEQTADAYIRAQHLSLGECMLQKRCVYLDQKFWIYCRNAARGMAQNPAHERLYQTLREGVASGILVCPASHIVLEETFKQSDPATRMLTAELVQNLSCGIAVQPFPVLSQAEILYFLTATRTWAVDVYPTEQFAWTYIGNLYGHMTPVCKAFDQKTLQAIQKAWFDRMAKMTFPILVEALAPTREKSVYMPEEFYELQNKQSEEHKEDFRSFKQAFLIELAGGLDVSMDELREAQLYLYEKYTGCKAADVAKADVDDCSQKIANRIYHAFRLGKIKRQLPGLRIMAGIHAAIRHKRQKYRRGDHHDHLHARVALPYCDLFLTEKNLGHLLTTKPLEYDALYGCRIAWEPEKAIKEVELLINE